MKGLCLILALVIVFTVGEGSPLHDGQLLARINELNLYKCKIRGKVMIVVEWEFNDDYQRYGCVSISKYQNRTGNEALEVYGQNPLCRPDYGEGHHLTILN